MKYFLEPNKMKQRIFLSDPSPIIGYPCHSLTHSVTFSRLDWCDPGVWSYSKLVEVVTVDVYCTVVLMMRIVLATVCCRFGSWGLVEKLNFCSDFKHKVWSRFWSWSSGKILKLEFVHHFAADVFVEVMKLNFGRDSEARFGQNFEF